MVLAYYSTNPGKRPKNWGDIMNMYYRRRLTENIFDALIVFWCAIFGIILIAISVVISK